MEADFNSILRDKLAASRLRSAFLGLSRSRRLLHSVVHSDIIVSFHEYGSRGPPNESFVTPKAVYYRFKPFNLFRRGGSLYFIPPRLVSFEQENNRTIASLAIAFLDASSSSGPNIKPIYVATFTRQGEPKVEKCDAAPGAEPLASWISEILRSGGYVTVKKRVGNRLVNELTRIDVFDVNPRLKGKAASINLAYMVSEVWRGYAKIWLFYMLRVGEDAGLNAVVSDPYYERKGSTRFIAIGYTRESLEEALGSHSLNNVALDLSCLKRLTSSRSQRHVVRFLESTRYNLSLGDLLRAEYTVSRKAGRELRAHGMRRVDIDDMMELDHFYRRYDINVYSKLNYFERGRNSSELLKVQGRNDASLSIETRSDITYVRRLYGVQFAAKTEYKRASEPFIPHFFVDTVVERSKSLVIRLYDPQATLSLSIASAAQNAYSDMYLFLAMRNLLLAYLEYRGSDRFPSPCRVGGSESLSWEGYLDLESLAGAIVDSIFAALVEESNMENDYQKRLREAQNLVIGLKADSLKGVWPQLLRCTIAWTLAHLLIKGAVSVFGPSFIEQAGVACEAGMDSCSLYIIEDVSFGAGFVDLIEQDPRVLDEIIGAMKLVARHHERDSVPSVERMVPTQSPLKAMLSCIGEIRDLLSRIGLDPLPIDVFRYVLQEVFDRCGERKACSKLPACEELAKRMKEDRAFEDRVRSLLAEAYGLALDECWDGCLSCVHISQRDLPEGLTLHEQLVYVSRRMGEVLASLLLKASKG